MTDLGIYNYIKNELAKGTTKEQIRSTLFQGGTLSPEIIDIAFSDVESGNVPVGSHHQAEVLIQESIPKSNSKKILIFTTIIVVVLAGYFGYQRTDALIPLIFGLLSYFKPDIFIKKNSENFDAKRAKFVIIGKVLIGVTVLLSLGSVFMRIGAPNNNAIISGSDLDRFVRIFADSCKKGLMNDPRRITLNISKNMVDDYCSCSANGVASQTTYKELKSDTANMEQKMNAVTSCDKILH